jgi:hypothetical protein
MNITDDNIELYLFRYKENLLDAAEAAEVERALATHREWQELADLYDPQLTLPAGAAIPYPDAATLRDGGPRAKRCRRIVPLWISSAVAACLLVAVGLWSLRSLSGTTEGPAPVVAEQQPTRTPAVADTSSTPMRVDSPALWEKETERYAQTTPTPSEPTAEEARQPLYEPLQAAGEPLLLAEAQTTPEDRQAEEYGYDDVVDDEDYAGEAVYSDKLITYADDISAAASRQAPDYSMTGDSRGDALSQLSDQVNDLASKSGSLVANTRRRYREHESQIVSDIEEITEKNPIIRKLLASIL